MDSKPDKTLSSSDPGDETLRRYDYQIWYSGIVALQLLKEGSNIVEIYCEQFEDVLVKLNNGKFIGVQVKTQDLDLGPIRTDDQKIIKALKRFVELDIQFPESFIRFTLVTNAGLDPRKDHHKNILHLVDLAKNGKKEEILKDRSVGKKVINKICKDCNCDQETVLSCLSKVKVQSKYGTIEKIRLNLIDDLGNLDISQGLTMGLLHSIADRIFLLSKNSSSLIHKGNEVDVFLGEKEPSEVEVEEIISGKRIDLPKLKQAIEREIEEPVSLFLKDNPSIRDIKESTKKLELKMDAGGISKENVSLAKDYKFSAEAYLIGFLHKHSPNEADDKYRQIRLAVKTECIEAHDEEISTRASTYGDEMLRNVRKRLRARRDKEPELFFGSRYEHLMGMAAILTEECEVWWSEKFDLT